MKQLLVLAIAGLLCVSGAPAGEETEEGTTITSSDTSNLGSTPLSIEDAKAFLVKINQEFGEWNDKKEQASWKFASHLTDANLAEKLRVSSDAANYKKKVWQEVNSYSLLNLNDTNLKRQFSKLSILGTSALPEKEYKEFEETVDNMLNVYSTGKICDFKEKSKCDLALEPELTQIMAKSRNPEELKHVWIEWRKASGEKVRSMFPRYVELNNAAAQLNKFTDTSEYWLQYYEADDITDQIESLWQEVKPFYLQIHAYVRRQLRKQYGENVVSKEGPIPAHLLGNMWAQTWSNIADFAAPYPNKKIPDVTEEMIKKDYNADKIFHLAEECFVSMNMSAMPDTFWKNSILEKPKDRELICHASAWDFYNGKDFRIKQCTRVDMENLITAHHEMGHIQYFLQYKDQPTVFKEGANPGFHEAVGDVMSLSVSTPSHLKKIGLLDSDVADMETDLNNLFFKALNKVVFLPFAYVMDQWRWDVFRGIVTPDQYNCNWWRLREDLQGIEPPVDRTEEDFDPAAKYHVVSDTEYIRYFVSFIVQFQFHKALCTEAGLYDPQNPSTKPLHLCDVTESTKAGELLKSMLQMGSSKPWQDAMEKLTGQRKMDASGLLEYFKPLIDWLKIENEKNQEHIGWTSSDRSCVQTRGELVY